MTSTAHPCDYLICFVMKIIPSFLVRKTQNPREENPQANSKTRYTSLDGLRGVAACSVTTYHSISMYDNTQHFGDGLTYSNARLCGLRISEERYSNRSGFFHLPFFRIIIIGPAAVSMFFIISGFVLSQRSIRLARHHKWEEMLFNVSSSAFRRPLRLYLPLIVATFITMILVYLNIMDQELHNGDSLLPVPGGRELPMKYLPEQVMDWFMSIWRMLKLWDWDFYSPAYDRHLWTIPLELRGSFVIFTTLFMLCRLDFKLRLLAVCLLIFHTLIWVKWELSLFLVGMMFAETSQIKDDLDRVNVGLFTTELKWPKACFWISRLGLYLALLLSLYLISTPQSCSIYTPGYAFLAYISPRSMYPSFTGHNMQLHGCVGTAIFVGLLVHWRTLNPLPSIFNSGLAQYVGRISYGIYIVHGPLLQLFGFRLFPLMWELTGRETPTRIALGGVFAWALIMFATIWLADLFTRGIDEPCVRLARRIESLALDRDEGALVI